MSENPFLHRSAAPTSRGPQGLADVLERILDKGLVIAGDVQINLLDIELLTIKLRLLVASADTAQQMGIDWWKHDPWLSGRDRDLAQENAILRDRLVRIEEALGVDGGRGPEPSEALGADGGRVPEPSEALAREAELPPLSRPPGSVTGEHHPEVQEEDP